MILETTFLIDLERDRSHRDVAGSLPAESIDEETRGSPRSPTMKQDHAHRWEFGARFRRRAFGWKSQPVIQRVKEAVLELKKIARKDKMLARHLGLP